MQKLSSDYTSEASLSALDQFRDAKQDLASWLRSVGDVRAAAEVRTDQTSSERGGAVSALTVRESFAGLERQIRADTFRVAVLGEYSAGKSSLLNVLLRLHAPLGRKTDGLLPTAVTPTTAVITTLVYDEDRAITVTLDDDSTLQVSDEQLNSYLTEPTLRRKKFWWPFNAVENEAIAERITQVRVGCVSPLLREGVEIVDTPGIGSINANHERITKQFTAEIDAALFLVGVDPPMGEREMAFLQHIKTVTDRCLFVQTKRDLGDVTEHGELVWRRREREHRKRIQEVIGHSNYPFFCVSALQAVNGLRNQNDQEFGESGFVELEVELKRFLVAERGVPRFERWIKRSRYGLTLLVGALRTERQQLEAKLINHLLPVAGADEYEQWQAIQRALDQGLVSIALTAEVNLEEKKVNFVREVLQDALRELSLTSAALLAASADRRLQLQRAVLRSVQYHGGDLLAPVVDYYVTKAQEALHQALGDDTPKAFQQFLNADFDWTVSNLVVDLSSLVTTETVTQEERRGGLGFIDWLCGPKKIVVTEHSIDKDLFIGAVEKATESTFREVKMDLKSTMNKFTKAVKAEMDRIKKSAKDAADQQASIQKQDASKCNAQLARNLTETEDVAQHQSGLERIVASVRLLSPQ